MGWQAGGGVSVSTAISSITDNAGNVYMKAGAAQSFDSAVGSVADIWYARNSVAGATSLTIVPNASVPNGAAVIWEFSGVDTGGPLDQTSVVNNQPVSATPTGAAVSVTSPSEAVVSLAPVSQNISSIAPGNGFITDSTLKGNGWAHLITTAPGNYAPQWLQSPAGTFASSTASFRSTTAQQNRCDLNSDGAVDSSDIQLALNMALGLTSCTANINGGGVCDAVVLQRVINAALGGACTVGNPHSVVLSWTASISSNLAGYNIYRGVASGGPYAKINPSPFSGTSFTDTTVQTGNVYFYAVTAIGTNNSESAHSNEAPAVIPYP